MRRESLIPFLPAALAAVTDVLTTGFVLGHQPDYPGRFIVFQVVMFGAALLAAVPNKWVRFVGFVILLAGVYISGMSVGMFYLPTFFAFVWAMVRDERQAVKSGPGPGQ
jgi:cell division protein FtsW (lipid II flippase)